MRNNENKNLFMGFSIFNRLIIRHNFYIRCKVPMFLHGLYQGVVKLFISYLRNDQLCLLDLFYFFFFNELPCSGGFGSWATIARCGRTLFVFFIAGFFIVRGSCRISGGFLVFRLFIFCLLS